MQPVPEGSKIQTDFDTGAEKLVLPQPPGNNAFIRYGMGSAAIFWIVSVTIIGLVAVLPQAAKSNDGSKFAFLIIFGVIALLGGAYSFCITYRALRPTVPETLLLSRPNVVYDSGIPPFKMPGRHTSFAAMWRFLFPKRHIIEITPEQLGTLELREHADGNRLTIDINGKRIEIGRALTDPDRRWLHTLLHEHIT